MTTRSVETETERGMLIKLIEAHVLPFTVSLTKGKLRTTPQNKLQRKWLDEIYEQLPGSFESTEYVRGYCKLHFGVPILRNHNDVFKKDYDEVVRPLPYEHKIRLMMVPFDFGVTRIMNTSQKTEYLNTVHRYFSAERGVILTDPEGRLWNPHE